MKKIVLRIMSALLIAASLAMPANAQSAQNLFRATDESTGFIVDSYVADALKDTFKGEKIGYWSDIGSGKNVFIDNQTGLFGHASIRIDNSADRVQDDSRRHTVVGINAPVEKGKTYTFQAWVKTQDVDRARVYLGAEYYQQNHVPLNELTVQSEPFLDGTNDWTLLSLTFTVPEADFYAATCGIYLWGATGVIWADGIALVEGSTPAAKDDIVNRDGSKLEPFVPATPTPTKVADRDFIGDYMQVTYVPETIQQHVEKQEKDVFTEAMTWISAGLIAVGCIVFLVVWRTKEQGEKLDNEADK